MRRLLRFCLVPLVCLGSGEAQSQTDARLWRYLHPDAKAVIGFSFSQLHVSALGDLAQQQLTQTSGKMPGLEFLKSVDRFLIASPGRKEGKAEPAVLVVVRGRFDQTAVRQALAKAGAKKQMYGTTPIYRPQGKDSSDWGFVLADAETILVGDVASLCAAVERSEFVESAPNPILARAAVLDKADDFWAVIAEPASLGGGRLQGLLGASELGEAARSFEFGLSLRDGLALEANIQTVSEEAAKRLADQLSKVMKLSAKDKPTNPALADVEKKIKVKAAATMVTMSARMTRAELEKTAKVYEQSLTAAKRRPAVVAEGSTAQSAEPPPAPVPPKPLVIRIEGLDEGTREIPLKTGKN